MALITSFRLLLWWGAEAAKNLIAFRQPRPQIQQTYTWNTEFPLSRWNLSRQNVYCLTAREGQQHVVIRCTGTISDN